MNIPSDAVLVDIDDKLKNVILSEINERRNVLAGDRRGCRMGIMKWDDELAKFASLNVMGCRPYKYDCPESKSYLEWFQHQHSFDIEGEDDQVEYIQEAFTTWYKMEPETYGVDYRRYVDMWLEDNYNVGCAAVMYTECEGNRKYMITCNYGTKFSEQLDNCFDCDRPGISCQTGTSTQYPNLCSSAELYKYL